jgi:hypothetical protein
MNSDDFLKPLTVNPTPVSGRLDVPMLSFHKAVIDPEQFDP